MSSTASPAVEPEAPAEPVAAPDAPVLDISTLVERKWISIDDVAYEIRNVSEFGVVESHALFVYGKSVAGLGEFETLSPKQAEKVSLAVENMIRLIVVDLPDDVLANLSDWNRSRIVQAWRLENDGGEAAEGDAEADPTASPTTPRS